MSRKKLQPTAGDITRDANEIGKEALVQAQAYLAQAQEYLGPRAQTALQQAQDYIGPLARGAKLKGARYAANAMDAARPHLEDALDRVGPAMDATYQRVVPVIDEARNKVQHGLLPWVSDTLHQAAEGAAALEIPEVARHIVVAEPEPAKKKCNPVKRIFTFLLIGGLVAGVVVALKKFLAPTDSGWQAHEPTSGPSFTMTPPAPTASDDAADAYLDTDSDDDASDDTTADEQADQPKADGGDAAPLADGPYGAGSFAGTEPPEGFDIKGNERSMKYHVKGNGGYQRTIADVWFNSEEAAEAAGFTKAQR